MDRRGGARRGEGNKAWKKVHNFSQGHKHGHVRSKFCVRNEAAPRLHINSFLQLISLYKYIGTAYNYR